MSTGLECNFIEATPGQWYYILETGWGPKNAWDWREYANAFGPFPTEDVAQNHLFRHHANPGGWFSQPYTEGQVLSDIVHSLIQKATR